MTLVAAMAATACSERYGELVGTYDITTTLATFTYVIPGASPGVDCPAGNTACYATVPATGATLTGSMVIRSGGEKTELGSRVFQASGDASGTWCTVVDATGCTSLTPSSVHFGATFLEATDVSIYVQLEQSGYYGYRLALNSPPMQGDSLVGTLHWYPPPGDAKLSYAGTFVARKRR